MKTKNCKNVVSLSHVESYCVTTAFVRYALMKINRKKRNLCYEVNVNDSKDML